MTDIDITHQFNEATNRRIGNVLIIIGIMLWTWLPYSLWEKKQFADNAAIVTGRIISNQGAPEVMFVLKTGETMKAKMYGWRPRDLKQDDVVEIVYSLKDPQKIELESNLWTGQLVIAILALASTVIGWLTRKGIMVAGPLKQ